MKRIAYYFDDSKYSELLDEVFPTNPMNPTASISFSLYNRYTMDQIMDVLDRVILNPKTREVEACGRKREEITCLPDKVKNKIVDLFQDDDLLLYGHGGNAKEILETGKMMCKYCNIPSHFIPLSLTNESLSKLNHWEHRDAHQILIMGLDQREFNPIYRKEEKGYGIPSEYFLGYYDRDLEDFIVNPEFKRRHEYRDEDPAIELHPGEFYPDRFFCEQENFNTILGCLGNIGQILGISKYFPLDKQGLDDVEKQVDYLRKKIYDEEDKITPEVTAKFRNKMRQKQKKEAEVEEEWAFDFTSNLELDEMLVGKKNKNKDKDIIVKK